MKKILQIGVCVVEIPEFSFKKKKNYYTWTLFFFFLNYSVGAETI